MNPASEPLSSGDAGAGQIRAQVQSGDLRRRHRSIWLGLLFVILLCAGVHLWVYLESPAGRFPVLDGAENFSLARQIANGTLAHAPFFRAMLYPALLALFLKAGISTSWLPVAAGLSGCLFHLGSTICVYWLARRAWASTRAGFLSALLFGLNPVAIYFAAEPLDTTFGLFLFLTALNLMHLNITRLTRSARRQGAARKELPTPLAGLAGGVFLLALALLARPHYAIVLAGLPVLLVAYFWRVPGLLILTMAVFALTAGVTLGAAGLIQKRICGEFRIMPTQGAYSLWVGNRPGANGRYYEQQIHFDPGTLADGENPARVESEVLYRRETGQQDPINVDRMNHYWREKTKAAVRATPTVWLGLMLRKVYYLFNNFEQYNNKTFAVQKQSSPVLNFNPLGWGLSLILCATGGTIALISRRHCAGGLLAIGVAALYAGGVILFFVSDRFRLPLLPFVCMGAGAWGAVRLGSLLKGKSVLLLGAAVVGTGLLTFSRAWGVYDLTPAIQDYVLLSSAAGKAGEDLAGLRWARKGLSKVPDQPDALACAVTSFYNSKLQGGAPEQEFSDESWALQTARVGKIPQPSPGVRLVGAVALWKIGQTQHAEHALRLLTQLSNQAGSAAAPVPDDALGVLLLAGLARPEDVHLAQDGAKDTKSFYLLVALLRRDTPDHPMLPGNRREAATQAEPFVKNIFP